MKKFLALSFLVGLLAAPMPHAEGSILSSVVERNSPYPNVALNTIEDSNREKITSALTNRFSVGDTLELHLLFETITNASFPTTQLDEAIPGYQYYQFAAIGRFEIADITGIYTDGAGRVRGDFVFTGGIDFYEVADATVDPDGLGGLPNRKVNFGDGVSMTRDKIEDGDLVFSLGIVDADDFIVAWNAPIFFADIPVSGTGVEALFGLSLTTGQDLGIVADAMYSDGSAENRLTFTKHDVTGSSESKFLTPVVGQVDPYNLSSNSEINFQSSVPEPASMLLWAGLAASIGLVGFLRRKS